MVTIGEAAPEFSCIALTKTGVKDFKLKDLLGKWKVLLFYVADFSAVCPTEIIAFNKETEKFRAQNIELIGIDTESQDIHKNLTEQKLGGRLNFPLLSDINGKIGKAYGVFNEEKKNERRATVIIDDKDLIKYICVSDNKIGRSTHEIYRAAMALKSGEACAVDWEPKI